MTDIQRQSHCLSIITTPRRELFYWVAILCTFALGTAAGDLATEAFGLGFVLGVGVFGAMIIFGFLMHYFSSTLNNAF